VTAAELSEILQELEKHPRIAQFALGDLAIRFREAAPALDGEGEPAEEAEPDEHELPDGVYDPRKAIERIYAKARRVAPKVEAG
jgi:hypothetical protein